MMRVKFLKIYNLISIAVYILSIAAYVYLQKILTPELSESNSATNTLTIFIIFSLIMVGICHIALLITGLKSLSGNLFNSIFIYMTIFSGITLLSDATLLIDIGKEYLLFDVSAEWYMLYAFSVFHLIIMSLGAIYIRKKAVGTKLLMPIVYNDSMFLSFHHIGVLSGVFGVSLAVIAISGILSPEKYIIPLMIFLAGLALIPMASFFIFWMVKLRKKHINDWFDEMQAREAALGAIFALVTSLPLYVLAILSQTLKFMNYGVVFWILVIFFFQLGIYSLTVTLKNKKLSQE